MNRRSEYQARSNEIISIFSKIFLDDIDERITAHLEMQEQNETNNVYGQTHWNDRDLV